MEVVLALANYNDKPLLGFNDLREDKAWAESPFLKRIRRSNDLVRATENVGDEGNPFAVGFPIVRCTTNPDSLWVFGVFEQIVGRIR